jgi:hypothetical protein
MIRCMRLQRYHRNEGSTLDSWILYSPDIVNIGYVAGDRVNLSRCPRASRTKLLRSTYFCSHGGQRYSESDLGDGSNGRFIPIALNRTEYLLMGEVICSLSCIGKGGIQGGISIATKFVRVSLGKRRRRPFQIAWKMERLVLVVSSVVSVRAFRLQAYQLRNVGGGVFPSNEGGGGTWPSIVGGPSKIDRK